MFSLEQSLALEIVIGFLVDNIALAVLILLLVVRLPCVVKLLHLYLLPERHGVLNVRHIGKVGSVGDSQTSHAVRMAPLWNKWSDKDKQDIFENEFTCKMSLEGLGSFVGEVSTNLTVVRDIETMQLVQPVGDWFA